MDVTLVSVKAGQIFNSRRNHAVEVDVTTSDGHLSTSAVPIALTEIYEALDLRDEGFDYVVKGVLEAVGNVNKIIGPALIGKNNGSQKITGVAPEFPNDVGVGMVLYSEYAVVIPLMVADKLCPRALVDTGSSVNVLFKTAFMEMGFNELQLHPSQQSLVGFGGAIVKPLGSISLPVIVEQGDSRFEAPMEFIVVDTTSDYDIILGEPFLVKSRASVIPYKQLIELHTEDGVVLTVRSNLRASRD